MQVLIVLVSLFSGGDVARGPRRVIWRTGGQARLEFRSPGDRLILHTPDTDRRMAAALVVLLRAFDSWVADPRDAKER